MSFYTLYRPLYLFFRLTGFLAILFSSGLFAQESDNEPDTVSKDTIQLHMHGADKELLSVMHALSTALKLQCDVPRWKVNEVIDNDNEAVEEALHAYGYYHARIQREITHVNNCWQVQLTLIPGVRTYIEAVDLQIEDAAKHDVIFMQKIKTNTLVRGEPLLHSKYEKLKKSIQSLSSKRGYFDGQFSKAELKVVPANNQAFITLHYRSGARYKVGQLQITQDAVNDELFEKYLQVKSADYFLDARLIATYQGLSGSGYFNSVDVTPLLTQRHNGSVPIAIQAVKGKPKSYSAGIGASTDTGPRLKFEHNNKLVNRKGHSYQTGMSLSPVISNIGFGYRIPTEKPQSDFMELSANAVHENTETSTSDTLELGFARSKLLSNSWTRIMGVHYSIDDFDVGEDNDTTTLFRPFVGFSKTVSDSPLRPSRGYRLNIETTAASSSFISDIDFIQAQINAKLVHSFAEKFRLLTRADLGYTSTGEFDELPSNLRFFAGGDNSVRGYEYESLGPEDNAGDVVGGERLIVTSVEADYLFKPDWSAALFMDAGNAFNGTDIDLKLGAGFGFRWQSPIGPIRVDIGFPVNEADADDTWRLHFNLGPDL